MSLALAADRVWSPSDIDAAVGENDDWRRYEIVDGVLVVSPPPLPRHDVVAFRLAGLLAPSAPAGYLATTGVGIDLEPSYRVTDATVVSRAFGAGSARRASPSDVLLAVEVESPSSITNDRITKPAQYAAAGIPVYWRVELDPLRLCVYRLDGATYREVGVWDAEDVAEITDPFPVQIDLTTLLP